MNIHTSENQAECFQILLLMNVKPEDIEHKEGCTCDGLSKISDSVFVIIRNSGKLVIHILEDCTEPQAWAFFEAMGGGAKMENARCVFDTVGRPEEN